MIKHNQIIFEYLYIENFSTIRFDTNILLQFYCFDFSQYEYFSSSMLSNKYIDVVLSLVITLRD